jgi:GAF domain-containing protein/HAMP domain-containing protein
MFSRMLSRMNIRTRLLLLCLAVSTPLMILGGYIVFKEYNTLQNEAQRATVFQAAIAVRTLSNWIAQQQDELRAIASLPTLRHIDSSSARQIAATLSQAHSQWQAVGLLDLNGTVIASSLQKQSTDQGEPAATTQAVEDPGLLRFFHQSIANAAPMISGLTVCPLTGKGALLACAPIFDRGRPKGFVLVSIEPQAIVRIFQGLNHSNGSVIAVVDRHNKVLARTLDNDRWLGQDYSNARTVQAAAKASRGYLEAVGIADPIARSYAFERVPSTWWLVILGVPLHTVYGAAQDRLIIILLMAACAVGLSIVLAYATTGHFTKSINELVREAIAVGRGDLTKRVRIAGSDELSMLGRAFNQMALQLEINHEQKTMVERIAESIRKSLDLNNILNTTVEELGRALHASRCCVAVIDPKSPQDVSNDQLVFNHVYFSTDRGGTSLRNRRVMISENSVLRRIVEQGSVSSLDVLRGGGIQPLVEASSEAEGLFAEDWLSIKSLMACPIATQKTLGLILIHQCDEHRMWTEPEMELVEAVAGHVALALEQARLYEQTKTLAEQQLLINHIVRSVRGSLDVDTILGTVTRELGEALKADRCQIVQPGSDGPLLVSHEFHQPGMAPMHGINIFGETPLLSQHDRANSPSVLGIDLTRFTNNTTENEAPDAPIAVIDDVSTDNRAAAFREFLNLDGTRSLIAAPLLDNNRLLGILLVHQCFSQRQWSSHEVSLVSSVADQLSVAISHARLFAQVKHQAVTDGLTELYNHVYLKRRLTEELRRAQRRQSPCALLMIDLDNLKQINDSFGHPVGDAAIRQVGWALRNTLRSGDTAARYGGEEFAVILPDRSHHRRALVPSG